MIKLSSLPQSWSALSWQQLCNCWTAKLRYGGNADVARCAALLALCGCQVCRDSIAAPAHDLHTGETLYPLRGNDGRLWTTTPRHLAHLSRKALPWFDHPYGDQGELEEKDETGKVTKEGRAPVFGYVNPDWRDAMELPEQEVVVTGRRIVAASQWQQDGTDRDAIHFALPERACINVTWHQYRSLQAITQMLFQDGVTDDTAIELQAQFLAYILLPEQPAQTGADRFARRHKFAYDADRAEQTVPFWRSLLTGPDAPAAVLYALCFQTYHTALRYYEKVFPLLYQPSGKSDPLHDALTGEVDTINCVMKYQGYTEQQQVYDTNLPIVLSVLNTMTKEAKEIEKMNSKIKRK